MEQRQPLPPFTRETAIQKVRLAEDGWNGRRQDRDEVKGHLVAALGILARYYGYERSGSSQHRRGAESARASP